jgi:hypothetical protein
MRTCERKFLFRCVQGLSKEQCIEVLILAVLSAELNYHLSFPARQLKFN